MWFPKIISENIKKIIRSRQKTFLPFICKYNICFPFTGTGPSGRVTIADAINNRRKTVLERRSQLNINPSTSSSQRIGGGLVFDNAAFDDTEY